ncbi:MAG: hypothetical protein IKO26_00055 [Paludibacteraceae bacterium]|nr:hypothetical protein [Paludibacteraceae bacterium]
MKIAEYKQLYDYLTTSEAMKFWEAIHCIRKIRRMSNKLLKALWVVLAGGVPDVSVGDVSFGELVNDEGMTYLQALLLLDWLERDPQTATTFMLTERMRKPIDPLNEEEFELVKQALRKLKREELVTEPESLEKLTEEEKSDIITHDEVIENNSGK